MLSASAFYKVIHTADIHVVDFFNFMGIEGNYVNDRLCFQQICEYVKSICKKRILCS